MAASATATATVYVRAKREKTTVFLEARKGDAAATLRNTLAAILEREPAQLRLLNAERAEINLARTLEENKTEDGAIIYYVYPTADGKWEEVNITKPEPASGSAAMDEDEDDEDDPMRGGLTRPAGSKR